MEVAAKVWSVQILQCYLQYFSLQYILFKTLLHKMFLFSIISQCSSDKIAACLVQKHNVDADKGRRRASLKSLWQNKTGRKKNQLSKQRIHETGLKMSLRRECPVSSSYLKFHSFMAGREKRAPHPSIETPPPPWLTASTWLSAYTECR